MMPTNQINFNFKIVGVNARNIKAFRFTELAMSNYSKTFEPSLRPGHQVYARVEFVKTPRGLRQN